MHDIYIYDVSVGDVDYWRSVAPSFGVRGWRRAMEQRAKRYGRAVVNLANGGAEIYERAADGTVRRLRLSPGAVRWSR